MRLLTNTVPLSPWRNERALARPFAYTSILKPWGAFNFSVGNLSAAVGSGGGTIGASLAPIAVSGRPCAQGGGASGAAGVCCAAAGHTATASVPSVPASSKRCRLAEHIIMTILPCGGRFLADVRGGDNAVRLNDDELGVRYC